MAFESLLIIVFVLMQSKRLKSFIPAAIWALLIFSVSSVPNLSTPSIGFKLIDKVAHFVVFFIFGLFVAYGFGRQKIGPARVFWISVGVSAFYGVTDEFHQFFVPGRQMDGFDMLADAVGAAVASGICILKLKRSSE